ncbi:uncharacterized protein VNE69_05207 [Vairimorpha necatrix]|uniref:Membrane protein n=1 Tax=Vairimorpha necatrix TaxID=6039 RepID=A0AAX4JCB5_9MICR
MFIDNMHATTSEYFNTLRLCYKDIINENNSIKNSIIDVINQNMCFIQNGLIENFPSFVSKMCKDVVSYYSFCGKLSGREYMFNVIKFKHNQIVKAECFNENYDFVNFNNIDDMDIDSFNKMCGIITKDNVLYDDYANSFFDSIAKFNFKRNNVTNTITTEINNITDTITTEMNNMTDTIKFDHYIKNSNINEESSLFVSSISSIFLVVLLTTIFFMGLGLGYVCLKKRNQRRLLESLRQQETSL